MAVSNVDASSYNSVMDSLLYVELYANAVGGRSNRDLYGQNAPSPRGRHGRRLDTKPLTGRGMSHHPHHDQSLRRPFLLWTQNGEQSQSPLRNSEGEPSYRIHDGGPETSPLHHGATGRALGSGQGMSSAPGNSRPGL